MRKLVVLLDGTGNRIGFQPSNVLRMLPLLSRDPGKVLAHYDQGVGTFGRPGMLFEWQNYPARVLGLSFGWGTRHTVERAYRFLCENYRVDENNQPLDDIHLYGFSRGAYAARLLAAVIFRVGLVAPQHVHHFPLIWQALTQRHPSFGRMGYLKSLFGGRKVNIHLLGLYDTVNSTGWLINPFLVPNTVFNPCVRHVRHALSLDEQRSFFSPLLWRDDTRHGDDGTPRVKQVWFAGSHSDIGGGYPLNDAGLANCTLHWMLGEACALGLDLDENALASFQRKKTTPADPCGTYHDSYRTIWSFTEWLPRVRWDSVKKKRRLSVGRFFPFGKRQYRPLTAPLSVHQSVKQRQAQHPDYRPDIAALDPQWVQDRPVPVGKHQSKKPGLLPAPSALENARQTSDHLQRQNDDTSVAV